MRSMRRRVFLSMRAVVFRAPCRMGSRRDVFPMRLQYQTFDTQPLDASRTRLALDLISSLYSNFTAACCRVISSPHFLRD